jgi:hypothetical protein
MKRLRIQRPSPAFVVAVVALFVALGGASYAAFSLPANSVGAKQLKSGAVTSKKIATRAVTAAKIDFSHFPTVPAATHADSATSATNATNATNAKNATNATNATNAKNATNATNASNAAELGGRAASAYALARTLQPTSAFIENGWFTGPPLDYGVAGYAKDQFGIVHLFGAVAHNGIAAGTIFTLPVGDRPGYRVVVPVVVVSNPPSLGVIQIDTDGTVAPNNGYGFVDLEGITFAAGG